MPVTDSKLLVVAAANTGITKRSTRGLDQSGRGAAMGRGWSVAYVDLLKLQASDAYANWVKSNFTVRDRVPGRLPPGPRSKCAGGERMVPRGRAVRCWFVRNRRQPGRDVGLL